MAVEDFASFKGVRMAPQLSPAYTISCFHWHLVGSCLIVVANCADEHSTFYLCVMPQMMVKRNSQLELEVLKQIQEQQRLAGMIPKKQSCGDAKKASAPPKVRG
jgi:hypothetical protein